VTPSDATARQRLHPVAALLTTARALGSLLPLLVLALLTGRTLQQFQFIGPLVLALSLLEGIGSWLRFRYWIEAGEFRTERGFIVRRRTFVPLERIQTVDVSAGVLQRSFGLVRLSVKSAAAGGAIELSAITITEAERLRLLLSPGAVTPELGRPPASATRVLTTRELVLLATTSGKLGIVFSVLAGLYGRVDDLIEERLLEYLQRGTPGLPDARPTATLIAIAVVVGLMIAWIVSVVVELTRFGRFAVTRQGDQLLISGGLLEQRQLVIPVRNVQAIRIVEGLLREPFGYAAIHVDSAGHAEERGRSAVLHPFIHRRDLAPLLELFLPEFRLPGDVVRAPRRSITTFVARPVLASAVFAAGLALATPIGGWAALLAVPAACLGFARHRAAGAATDDGAALLRWRGLQRVSVLVRRPSVQFALVSQSILQRRRGLASFEVGTASASGGRVSAVPNLELDDCQRLLDWCRSVPFAAQRQAATDA
jgi:putative membrane protein